MSLLILRSSFLQLQVKPKKQDNSFSYTWSSWMAAFNSPITCFTHFNNTSVSFLSNATHIMWCLKSFIFCFGFMRVFRFFSSKNSSWMGPPGLFSSWQEHTQSLLSGPFTRFLKSTAYIFSILALFWHILNCFKILDSGGCEFNKRYNGSDRFENLGHCKGITTKVQSNYNENLFH